MDPALLREREAFKRRAMSMPTVEKHKRPVAEPEPSASRPSKKTKQAPKPKPEMDYKSMTGSSQYKFSILAKIVKHLRQRHQESLSDPLNIDEILDETNQLDIGARMKHWLSTEALVNNPKVEVVDGDHFKFKPKYNVRDKKGLLRLLDKHDQQGLGGILRDDIEESLPNVAKALKALGDHITYVTRPLDKKHVLFYNDKSLGFTVDEDIRKLWRSVTVEGVDEGKIEEYLQKHNIATMQDIGIKKAVAQKRKTGNRKKNMFKSHNEHLGNLLQDFSQTNSQK